MRTRDIKKQFWLSEQEDYLLKSKSTLVGLNTSDFLRYLILGYKPKEKPPKEFYDNFKEIRRIGKNINQIARIANATNKVDMLLFEKQVNLLNDFILEIKNKYLKPDYEEKS